MFLKYFLSNFIFYFEGIMYKETYSLYISILSSFLKTVKYI
jgi:hypothetical protein